MNSSALNKVKQHLRDFSQVSNCNHFYSLKNISLTLKYQKLFIYFSTQYQLSNICDVKNLNNEDVI